MIHQQCSYLKHCIKKVEVNARQISTNCILYIALFLTVKGFRKIAKRMAALSAILILSSVQRCEWRGRTDEFVSGKCRKALWKDVFRREWHKILMFTVSIAWKHSYLSTFFWNTLPMFSIRKTSNAIQFSSNWGNNNFCILSLHPIEIESARISNQAFNKEQSSVLLFSVTRCFSCNIFLSRFKGKLAPGWNFIPSERFIHSYRRILCRFELTHFSIFVRFRILRESKVQFVKYWKA